MHRMPWTRLLLLLISFSAHAETVKAPHIEVELLSEREAVAPNETQYIGIRFKPEPDWHIYWKNPGDSGLPPQVEWQTHSDEISASPLIFPAPERIPYGPLVNYGYRGEILLLSKLETGDLKPGSEIEVEGNAKWLVCKQECVPGRANLKIKLPVVDSINYKNVEGANNALFAKTISELPIQKKADLDPQIRIIHDQSGSAGRFQIHLTSRDEKVTQSITRAAAKSQIYFFPDAEYGIEATATQKIRKSKEDKDSTILEVTQKTYQKTPLVRGVLKIGDRSYEVEEIFDPNAIAGLNTKASAASSSSLPLMLFFALVGGLILNLMPCILPVLSIKVMELIEKSGENSSDLKKEGLVYTLGVLVSFWALAAILLSLRASGTTLGWGFQLQSPIFVSVLAVLFFLMGLNLMGVFEVGTQIMGTGNHLTRKHGLFGSFFTGVLTTVAATPCSAPFMGTALGFALTQPAATSVLVLTFLGLGLALPYLVFSFFPVASKILPRPGKWMETLKQFLAFPLFGTVIWLVSIVSSQAGAEGAINVLAASLLSYFVIWLYSKKSDRLIPQVSRITFIGVSIVLGLALILGIHPKNTVLKESSGIWSPFSEERLERELAQKKTVLVNLTADWCVTCKVNETVAFENADVKKALSSTGVVALIGDWTQGDPKITSYMMRFGRNSVPVYLLYRDGSKDPEILPQILSPRLVLERLKKN